MTTMRATKRKSSEAAFVLLKSHQRSVESRDKLMRSSERDSDSQYQDSNLFADIADNDVHHHSHGTDHVLASEESFRLQTTVQLFRIVPRISKSKNVLRSPKDISFLNSENHRTSETHASEPHWLMGSSPNDFNVSVRQNHELSALADLTALTPVNSKMIVSTCDDSCYKAGAHPLHDEIQSPKRYHDVGILVNLLGQDSPRYEDLGCSSHHQRQSNSRLSGSGEELALLLKYTHVTGGSSALPTDTRACQGLRAPLSNSPAQTIPGSESFPISEIARNP